MTIVVEKAIVRLQGLGLNTARQSRGHLLAFDILSVGTNVDGIVFAQPPVLPYGVPIDRHITKNYMQTRARPTNFVAIGGEILDQRINFP